MPEVGTAPNRIFATLSWLVIVLALVGVARPADDPWERAPLVLQQANTWRSGDSIPEDLRQYRKSPSDLPDPTDSEFLISQITNLSLLAALATDVSAEANCREDAFAQGMYVGGPNRFFRLVEPYLRLTERHGEEWRAEIRRRISQPHVVVDALFIEDREFSTAARGRALDRIEGDLRLGMPWGKVYEKWADAFRTNDGHAASIGNLGHFVVFQDPQLGHGHFVDIEPHVIAWEGEELPRRLRRLEFPDSAHVAVLTRATAGDIVRLHSKVYHQTVLYQVQEVYSGRITH